MTTPNRPPLWEVMEQATGTVAEWDVAIRALRDWLVPEGLLTADETDIRALLTAEADRAERGDQSTSEND
jgi:hypothetical protein